jgi:hypothetical protein
LLHKRFLLKKQEPFPAGVAPVFLLPPLLKAAAKPNICLISTNGENKQVDIGKYGTIFAA